jgi:hypothetical protein
MATIQLDRQHGGFRDLTLLSGASDFGCRRPRASVTPATWGREEVKNRRGKKKRIGHSVSVSLMSPCTIEWLQTWTTAGSAA